MNIEILEKNNLQNAYLIHSDNTVDRLDLDKMEESLISNLKMDRADLALGNVTYQYEFLLLKGLDDPNFEGEKMMAAQYEQIIKGLSE